MPTPAPTPSASEISPEAELLLACACTAPDAEAAQRIRASAGQQLDWNHLIGLAGKHRVTPLLYWNLQALCPEHVPPPVMQALKDNYRASAQQNLLLAGELLRCLALLDSHGIPALPFKGPALATLAYGNLSLRPFGDLDILVREQDVLRVKQLLISNGYRSELALSGAREQAFLRTQYEYHFERSDGQVVIGLHYRVRPRHFAFALTPQMLWEQRETTVLCGQTIWSIAVEDQLLALSAHGTHHCWEKLSWICDIAQLLRTHTHLNWERLFQRARALGSERMLELALLLAHELLQAPIPLWVVTRLRSNTATKALARQVCNSLFDIDAEVSSVAGGGIFHLRSRERLNDRIRYCVLLAVLPTAEDWNLLPLPAPLAWVYSLIRPIRLALTYGLGPLRRLATRA